MNKKSVLSAALVLALATVVAGSALSQSATAEGRYIVKFRDYAAGARTIAAAGGRVAVELAPQKAIAAHLPEQALQGLQNNPNVEYVEADVKRYPLAESSLYGMDNIQVTTLGTPGSVGPSGSNSDAMICIIDSGYYTAHDDLAGNNVSGDNDPTGSGNWNEDTCGHGTHVGGTISAIGGNSIGVFGVNSNGKVRLHIEKVFNGSSCGWAYSSSLVSALNKCQSKATGEGRNLVVSMSLGGTLSSRTEDSAFQNAYNSGKVLSIAAAGNDGNTRTSYPAGYASVMSVAAVDNTNAVATFSQQNSDVEISAPGVGVLSTLPFAPVTFAVGSTTYAAGSIEGSARTAVTGKPIAYGGYCDSVGAWSGKIVLCERGNNVSFQTKVANVQAGGGLGAAIYNNVSGGFAGTLGTGNTSTIPAVSLSQEDGQSIVANVVAGTLVSVSNELKAGSSYEAWDGTSMATPHVSGVAGLLWSANSGKTNAQVRDAIDKSAKDLGAAGRDNAYGYGLIQAKAALDYLVSPPPSLTVTKAKSGGKNFANLSWSNVTTAVDIFRNGGSIKTNYSTGTTYQDGPLTAGTYKYKVCKTGATTCSNEVTVTF